VGLLIRNEIAAIMISSALVLDCDGVINGIAAISIDRTSSSSYREFSPRSLLGERAAAADHRRCQASSSSGDSMLELAMPLGHYNGRKRSPQHLGRPAARAGMLGSEAEVG
jgi:hypothetical protein